MKSVISFPEYTVKIDGSDFIPVLWFGEWKFAQPVIYAEVPQTWMSRTVEFETMVEMCKLSPEDVVVMKLKYGVK